MRSIDAPTTVERIIVQKVLTTSKINELRIKLPLAKRTNNEWRVKNGAARVKGKKCVSNRVIRSIWTHVKAEANFESDLRWLALASCYPLCLRVYMHDWQKQ